jgi:hypothetical protein
MDLLKEFASNIILQKVPGIQAHDLNNQAIDASRTVSVTYDAALAEYKRLQVVVYGETAAQKQTRLDNAKVQSDIMAQEVEKSNTMVNEYLAAYRGIRRIEVAHEADIHSGIPGKFYEEEILGRYDTRETVSYVLQAILDVNEIKDQLPPTHHTPEKIFEKQKENIELLLSKVSDSKRGNNRNNDEGIDDGMGDTQICSHGTCMRIIDAAHTINKEVRLSYFNPTDLDQAFMNRVVYKVKELPAADKQVVIDYLDSAPDNPQIIRQPDNTYIFHTDEAVPAVYSGVLNQVIGRMEEQFEINNPNPKLRIIQPDRASLTFRAFNQVNTNLITRNP